MQKNLTLIGIAVTVIGIVVGLTTRSPEKTVPNIEITVLNQNENTISGIEHPAIPKDNKSEIHSEDNSQEPRTTTNSSRPSQSLRDSVSHQKSEGADRDAGEKPDSFHPFIIKNSVDEIRSENRVRELHPTEESMPLPQLQNGVLGFALPVDLNFINSDWINNIRLLGLRSSGHSVEVHKTPQGEIYAIVYASKADVAQLQDAARKNTLQMIIQFVPKEEYVSPIGIPTHRLISWDARYGSKLGEFASIQVR